MIEQPYYQQQFEEEELKLHSLLSFTQISYRQEETANAHIHSPIEILMIQHGIFRIYLDDKEYTLHEGDVILFRSNTIHRIYNTQNQYASYYVLKIRPSFLLDISFPENSSKYLLGFLLNKKDEKTFWNQEQARKNGLSAAMTMLMDNTANQNLCYDISLKINTAFILMTMLKDMNFLHNWEENKQTMNENTMRRIYDALSYINCNYEKDLSALDCGKYINMSYSYFSRCFHKITGQTFTEYLNTTRLNKAKQQLLSTDKTITEIAGSCGFNNVTYFISNFHDMNGMSPTAFRKKYKVYMEE